MFILLLLNLERNEGVFCWLFFCFWDCIKLDFRKVVEFLGWGINLIVFIFLVFFFFFVIGGMKKDWRFFCLFFWEFVFVVILGDFFFIRVVVGGDNLSFIFFIVEYEFIFVNWFLVGFFCSKDIVWLVLVFVSIILNWDWRWDWNWFIFKGWICF